MTSSPISAISAQERAKRNQIAQKHQIAQELTSLEDTIRHFTFTINYLSKEMKRTAKIIENLKGRGGA